MSDWQVGDLAVCVRERLSDLFPAKLGHELPVVGKTYRVEGLALDPFGDLGLILEGAHSTHPSGPAWHSCRFRKIRPDEREACEPEFVTLLKRSRKTVRA